MSEVIYMAVQEHVQYSRVVSVWATKRLAIDALTAIIAKMPEPEAWYRDDQRKVIETHAGRRVAVWSANCFGPRTRQVSGLYVVRAKVRGSAIDRLAELAQ